MNFRKLFLGITAAALLSACAAPAPAPATGRASSAECFSAGQSILKINGIRSYNFYSSGDWRFVTEGGVITTNAVCVVKE